MYYPVPVSNPCYEGMLLPCVILLFHVDALAKNDGIARRSQAHFFNAGFFCFFCAKNKPPACFWLETLLPNWFGSEKGASSSLNTLDHQKEGAPCEPLCILNFRSECNIRRRRNRIRFSECCICRMRALAKNDGIARRSQARSFNAGFFCFFCAKNKPPACFWLETLLPNWFGSEKGASSSLNTSDHQKRGLLASPLF